MLVVDLSVANSSDLLVRFSDGEYKRYAHEAGVIRPEALRNKDTAKKSARIDVMVSREDL